MNSSNRILLIIFIIVNIVLYVFSYNNATFIEAADASQYYGPALSFVEHGRFSSSDGVPATFGTPLYSIFLAIPISIFGLEESSLAVVFLQSMLLYLTGFFSREILLQFSSRFGLLLHALVIFNPNSLITAHLAQSETLFTFIFVWSILTAIKIINHPSLKNIIILGFLTGLAVLTRPVAFYLMVVWPAFILIALIVNNRSNIGNYVSLYTGNLIAKLLIITLVGGLVIAPWYVRNYVKFGEVFLTSNAGAYLQAQYTQLKNKGSGWSMSDADKEHRKIFSAYLSKENKTDFCLENDRDWSCNADLSRASLNAIIGEPIPSHIKALSDSWLTLFFSGGASNIRNYLGFNGKSVIVSYQNNAFNGLNSVFNLLKNMNLEYLIIFIITTSFSVFARIAGLAGVFYILKNKHYRSYGMILIEVLILFVGAYLYLGQSRFRVPLEPILMLFVVIGVLYTDKIVKNKNKNIKK